MRTKNCLGCFKDLPLKEFNKFVDGKYGKRARCKRCQSIQRKTSADRTAKRLALEAKGKRKCSSCEKVKALSSFQLAKRKNRTPSREGRCKPCVSAIQKHNHITKESPARRLAFRYYQKPCVDCGMINPLQATFDHVRGKKLFDISNGVLKNYPSHIIQREINKCVIRCASCHQEKTLIERNSWRYRMYLERVA
jgi:hypothetical protein